MLCVALPQQINPATTQTGTTKSSRAWSSETNQNSRTASTTTPPRVGNPP